jgi:hypothetical protein
VGIVGFLNSRAFAALAVSATALGLARFSRNKVVTYREAIGYFVDHRPSDPNAVKGALLRERKSDSTFISWVFLDANDRICLDARGTPHGKRIKASALDPELEQLFGNNNLVIVQ